MFEIGAVDLTADSRQRLVALLHNWIHTECSSSDLVPPISIRSVSPDEIKFQSGLDLCVVGPEFLFQDIARLGQLKKNLSNAPLVCVCDARASSLSIADQVARLGAEDIFRTDSPGTEFLRRVLFLMRRTNRSNTGKLLMVEGGKGGAGATSIAAAVAEALVDAGRSVCLVDGDFESQDLSRFLLVKPFVNEPLELLLTGQRGLSGETVAECIRPVWNAEDGLFVVTPPTSCLSSGNLSNAIVKAFGGFIETLRTRFDYVVIDSAHLGTALLKPIYGSSLQLLFVASGDPAGFPAAGMKLAAYNGLLRRETEISLVLNGSDYDGLSGRIGLHELKKLSPCDQRQISLHSIPSCRLGRQWPASGRTLFSRGKRVKRALLNVVASIDEPVRSRSEPVSDSSLTGSLRGALKRLIGNFSRIKARGKESYGEQLRLLPDRALLEQSPARLVSQPQILE